MGLCRFLPIPSDRMGILWSLLTIKDSIVLEYGPAGTTHYSMSFFGGMGIEAENQIFTTHMSEEDVIMGDTTRLEESLLELDEAYKPSVIFVMASSISSVIGTDLRGICRYMQPKVDAKLIPFSEGGFKGDYSSGLETVYEVLVKHITEKSVEAVVDAPTFNIIGSSMGVYRNKSDINEICRLAKEGFGLQVGTILCYDTSVEDIKTMTQARVNLVISHEGLKAAKYLEKTYGMPYVYGVPYGYKGTLVWLLAIKQCLGVEVNDVLVKQIEGYIKEVSFYRMYKRMLKKPMKVFLYADYNRLVGLKDFFENELFASVEDALCMHSLKNMDDDTVSHIPHENERLKKLRAFNDTFVLADEISNKLVNDTNVCVCISQPSLSRPDISTHMPFVGINGANYLRECYEQYIKSIR